eukprot:COSAG02_NODE_461_length_21848_cov_235.681043_10_plen_57_part_00
MCMQAEMISQQPLHLNSTTEAVYAGENVQTFVEYRGPTPDDWWREKKEAPSGKSKL